MPLTLSSPAFADGDRIPERYTRMGENFSPPLRWSGVPEGTRSLVLIVDDPDAPGGTFGHWAVYNLSPATRRLEEAQSGEGGPDALRQAKNSFGHTYYDGPEPPRGHGLHHYRFRLAALDTPSLSLPVDIGALALWDAAAARALATAELVGTCERAA